MHNRIAICQVSHLYFWPITIFRYNVAARSSGGPSIGTRTVAGRIIKESYGAAKQQHTFTVRAKAMAKVNFMTLSVVLCVDSRQEHVFTFLLFL